MRADIYTAPVLFLLGTAMIYGGWTMDRLEIRQIHPASIPGLTPMLLGAALAVASIILFFQARSQAATGETPEPEQAGSARHFLTAAGLCTLYAVGLVGAIPFSVATFLFIAAFVFIFETRLSDAPAHLMKTAVIAVVLAAAVSAAMSLLFRYAFLVRLP